MKQGKKRKAINARINERNIRHRHLFTSHSFNTSEVEKSGKTATKNTKNKSVNKEIELIEPKISEKTKAMIKDGREELVELVCHWGR